MRHWLLCILSAFLVGGCSGGDEAAAPETSFGTRPAAVETQAERDFSVLLLPPAPTTDDDLEAAVRGRSGSVVLRWERNGEVLTGQADSRLAAHSFRKGDTVTVVATSGGEERRATVTIVNTPPRVLSVPFAEPYIHRGVDIVAEPQGVDVDGDPLDYRYRWSINGEEVVGNDDPLLPGTLFRKGDRVELTVVPVDDEGEGEPFNGAPFVVPNAPPVFVSEPPSRFEARTYRYRAQATDPDGDLLSFSLDAAPSGMEIDRESGEAVWEIGPGAAGEHTVVIVVEDVGGMRAFQEFSISLKISE